MRKLCCLVFIVFLCASCAILREVRRTAKMDSVSAEYEVEIVIPDRPEMMQKGGFSLDYEEQIAAWWKGQGRNGIPIEVNTPIKLTAITDEAVFISVTIKDKGRGVSVKVEGGISLDYIDFAYSDEHLIEVVSRLGDTMFHIRVKTKLLTRIEELDALL